MAGREGRGQAHPAQGHDLFVTQHAIDGDLREMAARIVGVAVVLAVLQRPAIARRGIELRPGVAAQLGDAAGMIEMGVAVDDDLDVLQPKTEVHDIALDQRGVLRQRAVEQDGAMPRRNQIGRQAFGADIIDWADDAERRDRARPAGFILCRCRHGGAQRDHRHCGGRQKNFHDILQIYLCDTGAGGRLQTMITRTSH